MYIAENSYYLIAGDLFVSGEKVEIRTTLGSCISLTAWHPRLKIAGMCHYLLAEPRHGNTKKPDNYYGVFALPNMRKALEHYAPISDYDIGLYGGGSLLFNDRNEHHIATKNITFAHQWLVAERITVNTESVGGNVCRSLAMTVSSGAIHLKTYHREGNL